MPDEKVEEGKVVTCQDFPTSNHGVLAYGHKSKTVTVAFKRWAYDEESFFVALDAHLTPKVARELSAALLAAADYAEGKS